MSEPDLVVSPRILDELIALRVENAALRKDAQRYLAVIAHIRGGHWRGHLVDYIDSEFEGFNAIDAIDAALADKPRFTDGRGNSLDHLVDEKP